jgi:hypothetical protein
MSGFALAAGVTLDELAERCKAIESAIVDVSLEYELLYLPPPSTYEQRLEFKKQMGVDILYAKDGRSHFVFSAARNPSEPNSLTNWRYLVQKSETLAFIDDSACWDGLTVQSYNGKICKRLDIGGWPETRQSGYVSEGKPPLLSDNSFSTSPLGFSVYRLPLGQTAGKKPLSVILKTYRDFCRLDDTVQNINGFNTVRVDLYPWLEKPPTGDSWPWARVYFSVDHAYTPVRYEATNGREVVSCCQVLSLEQVADGLWFPSSGRIGCPDAAHSNIYTATGKILVNQGLTEKDFDIAFPPGTKVRDEIKDVTYVVKAE